MRIPRSLESVEEGGLRVDRGQDRPRDAGKHITLSTRKTPTLSSFSTTSMSTLPELVSMDWIMGGILVQRESPALFPSYVGEIVSIEAQRDAHFRTLKIALKLKMFVVMSNNLSQSMCMYVCAQINKKTKDKKF